MCTDNDLVEYVRIYLLSRKKSEQNCPEMAPDILLFALCRKPTCVGGTGLTF